MPSLTSPNSLGAKGMHCAMPPSMPSTADASEVPISEVSNAEGKVITIIALGVRGVAASILKAKVIEVFAPTSGFVRMADASDNAYAGVSVKIKIVVVKKMDRRLKSFISVSF